MFAKKKHTQRITDSESDDDVARNHNESEGGDASSPEMKTKRPTWNSDSDDDDSEADPASGRKGSVSSDEEPNSPPYSSRSPSPDPFPRPQQKPDEPKKDPNQSTLELTNAERINRMEEILSNINNALIRYQAAPVVNDRTDNSWKLSSDAIQSSCATSSTTNIRWEHLPAFPTGIAANKMWEEWNRYVENFEIAASLNNVVNPIKRTQLLYLSMGAELQGIVNAAKLRPSLTSSKCYETFVTNIQNHLKSMTDTAAEHEAFSRMVQGTDESAVAFHARLMGKVRSCNYSATDEDRFVRAQLLTGLKNRELVKQARTYGYDTNFIVQSATRSEAFESEGKWAESNVLEIGSGHSRSYEQPNRSRPSVGGRSGGPPAKRPRYDKTNRRSQGQRCPRCSLMNHRNNQCPALSRSCNKCGKRGHFAAVCRQKQKQVNAMQSKKIFNTLQNRSDSSDDGKEDNKQVFSDL